MYLDNRTKSIDFQGHRAKFNSMARVKNVTNLTKTGTNPKNSQQIEANGVWA